jgi:hypothetical protein
MASMHNTTNKQKKTSATRRRLIMSSSNLTTSTTASQLDAIPLFCLDSVFFFNSKFAGKREEDDHFKLLSFVPSIRSLHQKMLLVGLSEATANFIKTFKPTHSTAAAANIKQNNSVVEEKQTFPFSNKIISNERSEDYDDIYCMVSDLYVRTFLQPEPGYWIVLCVKCKNSLNHEYQSPMFLLLKKLLSSLYETFALFHGPLEEIVRKNNVDILRHTLDLFLQRYLVSDAWPLKLNPQTGDSAPYVPLSIFYALDGISFLPVQSLNFLHLQSLMNCVMHSFNFPPIQNELLPNASYLPQGKERNQKKQKVIQATLICYESYLLFAGNGLEHNHAKTIYKYLPTIIEERMNTSERHNVGKRQSFKTNMKREEGIFITGPIDPEFSNRSRGGASFSEGLTNQACFSAPRIYLKLDNKIEEFHLIVYKYEKFHMCLLIRPIIHVSNDFYSNLKLLLDKEFKRIAPLFSGNTDADALIGTGASNNASVVSRVGNFDETYKYIYYNHSNLAVRSAGVQNNSRPVLEWNVVADMHRLFVTSEKHNRLQECYAKVKRDSWVVGKYFGQREFYLVFDQKNYSLVEINDQVHKMTNLFFSTNPSGSNTLTLASESSFE